jgi:hypothetical protein
MHERSSASQDLLEAGGHRRASREQSLVGELPVDEGLQGRKTCTKQQQQVEAKET